ncbi:DUF3253 domain-containing protein [Chitinophaga rhizophila]|uniref:DUF3253 domain-containing protein n=1 Tax=Chitinophaga rhizophila TaxID=2866212 RepID=A0ABS7G8V7_9BACT|nr:DUF3253 domain-containing protein [Chitinophaga rhizophila]MBW8683132.1 DUF3253 domain-containing protein [Chitinophaga rhizophila]
MHHNSVISKQIIATVTQRGPDKSTCPSEIARMLFPDNWRNYMQQVRDVAIELQKKGLVIITQKGAPVDINDFKGPIRIKLSSYN